MIHMEFWAYCGILLLCGSDSNCTTSSGFYSTSSRIIPNSSNAQVRDDGYRRPETQNPNFKPFVPKGVSGRVCIGLWGFARGSGDLEYGAVPCH